MRGHYLLTCCLGLLLVGCPSQLQTLKTDLPAPDATGLVSNTTGSFAGQVRASTQLISNNAGTLISNNAGTYRIASLDEVGLANALVYLMTLDEQFHLDDQGNKLSTTTDASGSYSLQAGMKAGLPVLVSVLLSGNRRMVGYTLSQAGQNKVDVSLATTYVTEFFRAEAAFDGKDMSKYERALVDLPLIVERTQTLFERGLNPDPDLTIGNSAAMVRAYGACFGSQSKELSDLWADLLGRRYRAFNTVAGNALRGATQDAGLATQVALNTPTGIALDPGGNLYIAETGSHVCRKVAPDGTSTVIGTFRGDGTSKVPELSPDATPWSHLSLAYPRALAADHLGNVILVPDVVPGAPHNNVLLFLCKVKGDYYGRLDCAAGYAYRLGSDDPDQGLTPQDRFKDGSILEARFQGVRGICLDDAGNMFVADRRNNLIRRIDRATGTVATIAGRLKGAPGAQYADPLDTWDGNRGDGTQALGAVINRPFDVAWRRLNETTHEVYVWEGTNPDSTSSQVVRGGNSIRRITFDPANPQAGIVTTVAGGRPELRGFAGDKGPADQALLRLVDPAPSHDVPNGGMALRGSYLYFGDSLNQRVRVIDLDAPGGPTIDTVLGAGQELGSTEGGRAKLKDPAGMVVDASGSVFVSEAGNYVVRKLNLQFGR